MVIWLYILILLCALLTLLLLLRLRVRLVLDDQYRLVFVGLGRSGSEINLRTRQGTIKIAGIAIRQFDLDEADDRTAGPGQSPPKPSPRKSAWLGRLLHRGFRRTWEEARVFAKTWWRDIRGRGDRITRAVVLFGAELLHDLILEQLEGKVEAGFDEPHLTGEVFGYYQAALGVFPALAGHVQFVPVWTGASFRGAIRVTVALPLYALVWRTVRLMWRLPITRLVAFSIHLKKGAGDVK
ncbi:MAG: hypothetical protein RBT76_02180 [candidate division Zixibacteria bacterium]|jgi:hypothetical protein|nr:hypothetical protein [candidate division Zixibacteria bacterium]